MRSESKSTLRPTLSSRWDDVFVGNRRRFNLVEITPIVSIDGYSFTSVRGDGGFRDTERILRGDARQQYDEQSLIMVSQAGATMPPSETSTSDRDRELFLMDKKFMTQFASDRQRPKKAFVVEDQASRNRFEYSQDGRRGRRSFEFSPRIHDELTSENITTQELKILIQNSSKKARLVYIDEEAKKHPSYVLTRGDSGLQYDKGVNGSELREPMFSESKFDQELSPLYERKRFGNDDALVPNNQMSWQEEKLVDDERMIDIVKAKLSWMLQFGKRSRLGLYGIEQVFDRHEQNLSNIFKRAPRLIPLMNMYGQKRWFTVCCSIRGRTFPWQLMLFLLIWVFCLYFLHSYGMGKIPAFAWQMKGWMYKVLGISIGFLLKQHAMCANQRWMEARKVWEDIIDNTRSLIVFLACSNDSPKMTREAVTHILGCPICIKNYLLGTNDDQWRSELMMVLPLSCCDRIMQIRRRTRAIFCLYACQRVVEVMVQNRLIIRPMVRDINPRIFKLSKFSGECSKIRWTRVPYQYIVHIRFVLVLYMMFLPLLLMGISEMTWLLLTFYLLLISYAYAGLESMATTILNPFGENESHLPLDLYCYLNIADTRFILGKNLLERKHFAHTFDQETLPRLTQRWTSRGAHDNDEKDQKKNISPQESLMDIIYELCLDKKEEENRRGKKKRAPLQHVSPQELFFL